MLRRLWPGWRGALIYVQPDTVVRWQRERFRRFWARLSKAHRRRPGRPPIAGAIRRLIEQLVAANPLWRAPRIHAELQMLGIVVSERTVSRVLRGLPRPPSQTCAPRYLIRDRDSIYRAEVRDRLTALGVEEVLTAPQSPWQNPYAERFDWFHSTGMLESFRDFECSASEEYADEVLRLLSLVTPI